MENNYDEPVLRRVLDERRAEGSKIIARAVIVVALVSIPFSIGNYFTMDKMMGVWFLLLEAFVLLYAGTILWLCSHGLYRPWFDSICTIVEASVPTVVVLIDIDRVGVEYALTSGASVAIYNVAIFTSSLRLRPKLSILSGLIAVTEFLWISITARFSLWPETVALLPSLAIPNLIQRSVYLLISGGCAYWLGRSFHALIIRLYDTAVREMRVISILGRHVTRKVADVLLDKEKPSVSGERREITVMFCDIRGFTKYTEQHDPSKVVELLNEYYAACTHVIDSHGGVVNKFLGDGFLAIFGAPVVQDDHAQRAVDAALKISECIDELYHKHSLPGLDIGIGVHTGEAIVGVVGSPERSEYTVVGDTVNCASHIEEITKTFHTRILVSDETHSRLDESLLTQNVGLTPVKGRAEPVDLWIVGTSELSFIEREPVLH